MSKKQPAIVKLRAQWCLYPRGCCALCLYRMNTEAYR